IEEFLDDLSNWYVRRSRRRFWKSRVDADKQAAYETLYKVLTTLCKLLAPFVPFVTEAMYQNLVRGVDARAPESVHHCDFPKSDAKKLDAQLLPNMDAARQVVTLGHGVRGESNLKVRQPLARVLVVVPPETRARLARMQDLIMDELNVKKIEFVQNESELVSYNLLPDNRALGPKFGARFPRVRAALAQTDAARAVATLRAEKNLALNVDGEMVELAAKDVIITPQPRAGFAVKSEGEFVVALDTKVTDELRAEMLAREFVRHVQDLRKSAGFEIDDRITTHYVASDGLARAIRAHAKYIAADTLSVALVASVAPESAAKVEDEFDGERVALGIVKAKSKVESKKVKVKPAARKIAKGAKSTKAKRNNKKAKAKRAARKKK
ncbi:MAG: class I tRNA ligase family protein, partial [Chloroflexi bacterium]|nr:class I tRNA ligase family protein [Chloroflexota bacterium]